MNTNRVTAHIGFIPDGNRRWAAERGLPCRDGYAAGIDPGIKLLRYARDLGIGEITAYGFTKENIRRPKDQVVAFQRACVEFAMRALDEGVALLVVGDAASPVFPDALRRFAEARTPGDIRFNLLVNYGWQWDVSHPFRMQRYPRGTLAVAQSLGSAQISRIDLVVRWGGRSRLSGFLPMQCAYADFYTFNTLWPDMQPESLHEALAWYAMQDVTLGG